MFRWLLTATLAVVAGPLPAQMPQSFRKAAETITPDGVERHIRVLADDSMMGRDTPSPGLEAAARYVAEQFKKFGLKPGGDNGAWIQRYPVPKRPHLSAPNIIGILEGTDPKLKHEHLIFVAHMDHIGYGWGRSSEAIRGPVQPADDSIYNGADDNASGTAGLIELAHAFSRPGARTRRSLIFLAVSGEEYGRWGSKYFVEHPPVPLDQLVASINMDMIGRSQGDTVKIRGGHFSDLGALVSRLAPAHPAVHAVIQQTGQAEGSDHATFSEKRVPVLGFHTGSSHIDYHRVTDSPEKANVEAEARILRLIFHAAQEIAGAARRPVWNEESYRLHQFKGR